MWLAQAKGKPAGLIGFKTDILGHVPEEAHEHILASLH